MRALSFFLFFLVLSSLEAQTDTSVVDDVHAGGTITREAYFAMINPTIVSGTITDRGNNEAVIGAVVNVYASASPIGTMTDPDGHYELRLPSGGSYLLRIRCIGYETEILSLTIETGKTGGLNLSLCQTAMEVSVTVTLDHPDKNDSAVQIITGGLPVYFDPSDNPGWIISPVVTTPPDSFAITNIRHATKNAAAAELLRAGTLYQYNDSLFYFKTGSCPRYRYYHKRGDVFVAAEWSSTAPGEFTFRKKRHGWKISSGGVSATCN